jgi:hypothetical protein
MFVTNNQSLCKTTFHLAQCRYIRNRKEKVAYIEMLVVILKKYAQTINLDIIFNFYLNLWTIWTYWLDN